MAMSLLDALNVQIVGEGDRICVLGHGFGTTQSAWRHLVPYLMNDYKVILYDLMGAGTTACVDFDFARYSSLYGYADDLLQILEELDVEECIYIGHSVSGMIGCLASLERPGVFKRIIGLSVSPRYLNDSNVGYIGGFEQADLQQLFHAMQSNYKQWAAGFAPLAIGLEQNMEAVKEFSSGLFEVRPDIALSVSQTIFQSDMRSILPQVSAPCHFLLADKDLAVPTQVLHYLNSHVKNSSIELINAQGHLPHLSCPTVVNEAILRHLQRT